LSRRLMYFLSPQMTIYSNLREFVKGKTVLEVGYCTGFGTLQYACEASKVVAIEIDMDSVDFANKVLPVPNVSWEYGDICRGVLGRFDVIVMIETIEHIPRWQNAFEKCRELLLPGGKMIISTPNANGTYLKNELHGDEWTAQEFKERLEMYFKCVKLFDFSLKKEQDVDTRITPLVAVCDR
jgi:2-polyprenyl-3-methyl-5-hydroxy-6-metoxy-1,4-benzoquinol methylase